MKKVLITMVVIILALVLFAGGFLLWGDAYAKNYKHDIPDQVDIEPNSLNTITAVGRGLYTPESKQKHNCKNMLQICKLKWN